MNGVHCQTATAMIVGIGNLLAQSSVPTPNGLSTKFTMPNTGWNMVVFQSSAPATGMIRNGEMSRVRTTALPRNFWSSRTARTKPTIREKITAALCHGTAILAYARLSDGRPLVEGRTVTGFPNVEEDAADRMTWEAGALPAGRHIMPWRIEDEVRKLGANYIQAGAFRSFAIRDGNLVTGQQNYSGAETARLILEAVGR